MDFGLKNLPALLLGLLVVVALAASGLGYGLNSCQSKKATAKLDNLEAGRDRATRLADSTYYFDLGRRYEINRLLLLTPLPDETILPPGYSLPAEPSRQGAGR